MPQHDHHGEQRRAGEIRDPVARLIVQLGELGSALAAVIAAALHSRGELVGTAEGADEQRHKNGHHRLGPAEQIPGFKIRASGLLGGHDLVRLLDERRDEAQSDGHHHRKLMDGRVQLFERREQTLEAVGEGDRRGRIG